MKAYRTGKGLAYTGSPPRPKPHGPKKAKPALSASYKAAQRQLGDVVHVQTIIMNGSFWWFQCPVNCEPGTIPPGVQLHGPFATDTDCDEDQRLVLFGPQCERRLCLPPLALQLAPFVPSGAGCSNALLGAMR